MNLPLLNNSRNIFSEENGRILTKFQQDFNDSINKFIDKNESMNILSEYNFTSSFTIKIQ